MCLQVTLNRYYALPTWTLSPGALGFSALQAESRARTRKAAAQFPRRAAQRAQCDAHPQLVHAFAAIEQRALDAAAAGEANNPYDLPDLAALLAQSQLLALGPIDHLRYPLTPASAVQQYNVTLAAFRAAGRQNAFQIMPGTFSKAESRAVLLNWLVAKGAE